MELSVLARQCLARRIPDQAILVREIDARQQQRNDATVKVDGQFTTADAHIKLRKPYPSIELQ